MFETDNQDRVYHAHACASPLPSSAESADPASLSTGGRGALLIELMRLVRMLRAEYRAANELLVLAIEMLHDRDAELDRVRAQNDSLRQELRRYTAHQVAAERAA